MVEIELKSGRSIFVIAVEDIIIHRLESVLVSNVQFPEDHEDYQWHTECFCCTGMINRPRVRKTKIA
ncbi:hypothetical protein M3221_13330 [Domibacillus indicus]|uniref:hypothetical protein n=1 Tax=Domibacillus indicus TaxID=1437523 RepID=UPI0020418B51|nr:hypothetical protein [Domibacillus indicus]MCM3789382.1 hypothetical protein [Domibacillus indicus]